MMFDERLARHKCCMFLLATGRFDVINDHQSLSTVVNYQSSTKQLRIDDNRWRWMKFDDMFAKKNVACFLLPAGRLHLKS